MATEFKSGWGNTVKIITIAITLLFAALIAVQVRDLAQGGGTGFSYFLVPLLLVIYFVAFALRTVKYTIDDEKLTIHKQFGKRVVPLASIKSAQLVPKGKLSGAIRTFGIGGLFGFSGQYHLINYGSMTFYLTRFDNPVVIEAGKSKIAVSPDEPERFLALLQKSQPPEV